MLKKRGQSYSQPFLYFLIVIVAVLIIIFGYTLLSNFKEKSCDSQYAEFKVKLEESVKATATQKGSVKSLKVNSPCNAERILFVDHSKEVIFDSLEKFPLIKDIVYDRGEDNVFFIKEGSVLKSDNIGNINLKMPYFLCTKADMAAINLMVEGAGEDVIISKKDDEFDCTFDYVITIELTEEDIADVFDGIVESIVNDEIRQYIGNIDAKYLVDPVEANLTRAVEIRKDTTTVTIKKTNGKFQYYENIPKCMIEDLKEAIELGIITFNPYIDLNLSNDPLIMWNFNEEENEEITYIINKAITPSCLRGHSPGLFGIGLTNLSFNDSINELTIFTDSGYDAETLLNDYEDEIEFADEGQYNKKAKELITKLENEGNIAISPDGKQLLIKKIVMHENAIQKRDKKEIRHIQEIDKTYREKKEEKEIKGIEDNLNKLKEEESITEEELQNIKDEIDALNNYVVDNRHNITVDVDTIVRNDLDTILLPLENRGVDKKALKELRENAIKDIYTNAKKRKACDDGEIKTCGGAGLCERRKECIDGNWGPCEFVTAPPSPDETDCNDGIDNNCDEKTDCEDEEKCPCSAGQSCVNKQCTNPLGETSCSDNLDNDWDNLFDCDDTSDCPEGTACGAGKTCQGGQCKTSAVAQEENCMTTSDEDGDGQGQCKDTEDCPDGTLCSNSGNVCFNKQCIWCDSLETSCNDLKDNDCDGLPDCYDPDCNGKTCDDKKVCSFESKECVKLKCKDKDETFLGECSVSKKPMKCENGELVEKCSECGTDNDKDGYYAECSVNPDCDDDTSDDPATGCPKDWRNCNENTYGCAICKHPYASDICVDGKVVDMNCNNKEDIACYTWCYDYDQDGYVTDYFWNSYNGFRNLCKYFKTKGDCIEYDANSYPRASENCYDSRNNNCDEYISDCSDPDCAGSSACCECASGECCDGCNFKPLGTKCNSFDCDTSDTYYITGTQSAKYTSYCAFKDYKDCDMTCSGSSDLCPNLCSCNIYSTENTETCGLCKYAAVSSDRKSCSCEKYLDGISCGNNGETCHDGECGQCGKFETRPCGTGEGECIAGTQSCIDGRWSSCIGEVTPAAETCDGKDNDCDGQVDEGLAGCGPRDCSIIEYDLNNPCIKKSDNPLTCSQDFRTESFWDSHCAGYNYILGGCCEYDINRFHCYSYQPEGTSCGTNMQCDGSGQCVQKTPQEKARCHSNQAPTGSQASWNGGIWYPDHAYSNTCQYGLDDNDCSGLCANWDVWFPTDKWRDILTGVDCSGSKRKCGCIYDNWQDCGTTTCPPLTGEIDRQICS